MAWRPRCASAACARNNQAGIKKNGAPKCAVVLSARRDQNLAVRFRKI
jgi:hypothetical protein